MDELEVMEWEASVDTFDWQRVGVWAAAWGQGPLAPSTLFSGLEPGSGTGSSLDKAEILPSFTVSLVLSVFLRSKPSTLAAQSSTALGPSHVFSFRKLWERRAG